MKQQPTWRVSRRTWLQSALSVLATPLAGCGGAELVAFIPGVGTGGTGVVAGILTGLGSLIVDGQRYDESQATLLEEPTLGGNTPNALTASAFQVGHCVEMTLDSTGQPTRVVLNPQLIGPLENVDASTLWVMGQQVQINLDSSIGPVTVFSGCSQAQLPQLVGQGLRIYGDLVADNSTDTLYASRIEYLGTNYTGPVRLTATLRFANGVYQLGRQGLNTQGISTLAEDWRTWVGQVVIAVGSWPTLVGLWSPTVLKRKRVTTPTDLPAWKMNGRLVLRDGLWYLQGQVVDMGQISNPESFDGLYVCATLNQRSDGVLMVTAVSAVSSSARMVSVSGAVQSFIDQTSFVVRGTPVNANNVVLSSDLSNGQYVKVTGQIQEGVLSAVTVSVIGNNFPDRAVLMLQGTVQPDGQSVMCDVGEVKLQLDTEQASALQPGQRISLEGYWNLNMGALDVKGHPSVLETLDKGVIPVSGILDAVDENKGLFINGRWIQVDSEDWNQWRMKQGQPIDLSIIKVTEGFEKGQLKAKPKPPAQ